MMSSFLKKPRIYFVGAGAVMVGMFFQNCAQPGQIGFSNGFKLAANLEDASVSVNPRQAANSCDAIISAELDVRKVSVACGGGNMCNLDIIGSSKLKIGQSSIKVKSNTDISLKGDSNFVFDLNGAVGIDANGKAVIFANVKNSLNLLDPALKGLIKANKEIEIKMAISNASVDSCEIKPTVVSNIEILNLDVDVAVAVGSSSGSGTRVSVEAGASASVGTSASSGRGLGLGVSAGAAVGGSVNAGASASASVGTNAATRPSTSGGLGLGVSVSAQAAGTSVNSNTQVSAGSRGVAANSQTSATVGNRAPAAASVGVSANVGNVIKVNVGLGLKK